jgi:endonuclease/exonuclease/phosphatase family metal-dependent hydrolase
VSELVVVSSLWTYVVSFAVAVTVALGPMAPAGTPGTDPTTNPSAGLSSDTGSIADAVIGAPPSSAAPSPTQPTQPTLPVPDAETADTAAEHAEAVAAAEAREAARKLARKKAIAKAIAKAEAKKRAEERAAEREKERRKERRKARALAEELRRNPPVKTPFTLASFNALGASHTEGRACNKCALPDSTLRTRLATELFRTHGVDVVGLQEFQPAQQRVFSRFMPNWGVWGNSDNHVAWDRAKFEFVSGSTFTIPYFGGQPREMPVVRLRSLASGQEMTFISVHNPADVRGNAAQWRAEATRREVAVVADLRDEENPTPVFMTGDMNERAEFFCAFTADGNMHNAGGGTHIDEVCTPPEAPGIDWVFGSTGVEFTGYARITGGKVAVASDHPLVVARVG